MNLHQAIPPCPGSPNCVSSLEPGKRGPAPIPLTIDPDQALSAVEQAVSALPGAALAERNGPVLRFVFTSRIFRFKDDVTFFLDAAAKLLHFRSASRVGWWDLGANRRRMKRITALLAGRI